MLRRWITQRVAGFSFAEGDSYRSQGSSPLGLYADIDSPFGSSPAGDEPNGEIRGGRGAAMGPGVEQPQATVLIAFGENAPQAAKQTGKYAGDVVQCQVLLEPDFVQLCPLCNCRGTIGIRNHCADGNHDHVSQAMESINRRPRVRQIIEEPQDVYRILFTNPQH